MHPTCNRHDAPSPPPPPGPYVAELYASFEDPSCVYMIMEYCEGGDLFKTMLMHGGVLEEQWVCVEVRGSVARLAAPGRGLK
jgi:serine/threonine protein kinase